MKANLNKSAHQPRFKLFPSLFSCLCCLVGLLACTGCNRPAKVATEPQTDPTGTYNLVSIDGKQVPCTIQHEGHDLSVRSGSFVINTDGTCASRISLAGRETPMEVKATYDRQGSTLTMRWAGAGTTAGKIEGDTFTMLNEGMSFAYRK